MSRYVVKNSTGEVVTTMSEGDRILRSKSRDKLSSMVKINRGKLYVKVYAEALSKMIKDEGLSGSDMTVLFTMIPYIRFESGLIAHDNGKYISMKSLAGMVDLSERTVYRSIEKLVQRRIIARVRTGHEVKFYANPFIFMRGSYVNKTLESIFRTSKYNI